VPDTRKRVRIVTGHYPERPDDVAVLVDGEPLRCVTRISFDHDYSETRGLPLVTLTLIGVDVDLDLEGAPDYLVRVVGPRPPDPAGQPEGG
jgi:hypothetical protein